MPMKKSQLLLIVLFFVLLAGQGLAAGLADYKFLKISVPDQRAVVKNPQGKLQVIAVGDGIAGTQVTEIADGRVVLTGKDGETVIVRVENGKQRIETIQRFGEQKPDLTAPVEPSESTSTTGGSDASY